MVQPKQSMMDALSEMSLPIQRLVQCSVCKKETSHSYSSSIWHQPKVCVFVINRFQTYNNTLHKDESIIYCNPIISLPTFSGKLVGIVEHFGQNVFSGHYTCFVDASDTWYLCNDSSVSTHTNTTFCHSKEAYLLFYTNQN